MKATITKTTDGKISSSFSGMIKTIYQLFLHKPRNVIDLLPTVN